MEVSLLSADSDEREEGEIVDDDLEDISDSSITMMPLQLGKCVSSKGHLRGLSLSSISDGEPPPKERHRRKSHRRKRRTSRRRSTISVSDSDSATDKRLRRKQLKAAVAVDKDEIHQNSLEIRLKLMNDMCKQPKEPENSHSDIDKELIQLRAAALKTTLENKYNGKKRKLNGVKENIISDNSIKSDVSDTNKENNHNENCKENGTTEVEKESESVACQPHEEDEDVLRAVVLASMSKKITSKNDTESVVSNGITNSINTKPIKSITNTIRPIKKPMTMPLVKPLIISISKDSDTDESENEGSEPKKNNLMSEEDIKKSVDSFLKEQRAQVEATTSTTATPCAPKKATNNPLKSAVKLLPKDKQREYHELLQKLAAKKKNLVHKATESKCVPPKPKPKVTSELQKADTVINFKRDVHTFRKVYKEIQTQPNGRYIGNMTKILQQRIKQRLQIQDKYTSLKPVVDRVFEIHKEKTRLEKRLKELMMEVNTTKKKVERSQQVFCNYVKQLVVQKSKLDQSSVVKHTTINLPTVKKKLTQNTIKNNVPKKLPEVIQSNEAQLDLVPSKTIQEGGRDTINFGDPNDIDKILKMSKPTESISKYVSPLDTKRTETYDPLSIVCPFEIDGKCRDKDCGFKHFL